MLRAAFLLITTLGFVGPSAAQTVAQTAERRLTGTVIHSDTHAPIDAVIVISGERQAITDKDGAFTLLLPAKKVVVEFTATGFFPLTTTVDLADHDVTGAQFTLAPNKSFASEVSVVASAPASSPSATPVAPADVLKTPGALDNVFRTLQTMPGVAATEEFGSRLTVRGGAPDQNLTVMDGVEIHDPYRLFGLTSAFNPEIIRRFELATSGFSAKYGDRLSSLLVIDNRDGDSSRAFGGSAALSITDANIVFEGKMPKRGMGSWLVTGRRTYYDLVAERITDQQFPGFADVQAKGVWEPGAGRRVTFFGLRSRQSAAITFDEKDSNANGEFNDDTNNDLASIRFDTSLGTRGHSMTVAGYSNTASTFGVAAAFTSDSQRSNSPNDTIGFSVANVAFSRELNIRDVSVRHETAWAFGAHAVEIGGEVHRLTTAQRFVINGDRNPNAANGSSVQGGAGLPDLLDSRRQSTRGGAWLTDSWRLGTRASIETGLRFDRAGINGENSWSPRFSAIVSLSPRTTLRAGAGLYTQSPGYEKAAQSDYVLDFTSDTTASLKSERAVLMSAGIDHTIGGGLSVKAETYYKRLDRVLLGRLETEAEQRVRLAPYDFPAALQSSLPTTPLITTTPTNDGRGRAYGFDLMLSRMTAPLSARFRGWTSYTWGKAEREAYGRTYPFEYDRRHAVSSVLSYRLSRKWEVASTFRWAKGFPRTAPIGLRVAATEVSKVTNGSAAVRLVPARDITGLLVYALDFGGVNNLNTSRLPDFARLDVRASWKPRGQGSRWEFYAEVINLTNRKNAGSITPTLAYNPGADRPRIVEQNDPSVPRLPTIGLRWRF